MNSETFDLSSMNSSFLVCFLLLLLPLPYPLIPISLRLCWLLQENLIILLNIKSGPGTVCSHTNEVQRSESSGASEADTVDLLTQRDVTWSRSWSLSLISHLWLRTSSCVWRITCSCFHVSTWSYCCCNALWCWVYTDNFPGCNCFPWI